MLLIQQQYTLDQLMYKLATSIQFLMLLVSNHTHTMINQYNQVIKLM